MDSYVKENGSFFPVKLLNYGAQTFYLKTKACVEGETQQRAII